MSNRNAAQHPEPEPPIDQTPSQTENEYISLAQEVHHFLESQTVLHLATCRDGQPWSAAVYFVHRGCSFYYISDKESRHCPPTRVEIPAAAAISADSADWRQIRGVQMSGVIRTVSHWHQRAAASQAYLAKFPFAGQFVRQQFSLDLPALLRQTRLKIFCFQADRVLYLDNRRGLGTRLEVALE